MNTKSLKTSRPMSKVARYIQLTLWVSVCCTAGLAAAAEENQPAELHEVVVSAERRHQSVQDVSISMAVFTGQQLQQQQVNTVENLIADVPDVSFDSYDRGGRPQITIRGIGVGSVFGVTATTPVSIYYDDVLMGARSGQLGQVFDEERVEVLRGPQGTLFGRNTTAGAINFISRKPGKTFEANGTMTYGRWNQTDFEGGVTIPMSDTLSMRVAGVRRKRDGWQTNINPAQYTNELDNVDDWGARALLQWTPNQDMTWLLNIHGNAENSNSPVVHADRGQNGTSAPNTFTPAPGYIETGRWDTVSLDVSPYEHTRGHGAALTGTIHFGSYTLTWISGYERVDYNNHYDGDGTPFVIAEVYETDHTKEFSQELRLAAKQGRFDWVGGIYLYHESLDVPNPLRHRTTDPRLLRPPAHGPSINTTQLTQIDYNYAIFGDLRYALTDTITLGVGGRYTHEQKSGTVRVISALPPVFDLSEYGSDSWNAPTGRVVVEWRPVKYAMIYASASRGFRSGGLTSTGSSKPAYLIATYDPETVNTYEIGEKSEWLDDRLFANIDVFYNDLTNSQQLVTRSDPVLGLTTSVENAAAGRSYGAEFDLRGRWRRLTASLGVALLHSRFDKFLAAPGEDLSGKEFQMAPHLSGNCLLQYEIPLGGAGSLAPDVNVSYKGREAFDAQWRPIDIQGGYTLVDASLPWRSPDARWEVTGWIHNATDKHYYDEIVGDGAQYYGAGTTYHALPRSYGFSVSYTFD